MIRYQITTLVDITRSNPQRSDTNRLRQGQQANFNSLIQAIGMRSNVEWTVDPKMSEGTVPDQDFRAQYWTWEFEVEREQVFDINGNPVGHLINDLNGVPIIPDLTNEVVIEPAAFITQGEHVNTWVRLIS